MSFTPGPWKWDQHGGLRGKDRNAVINPTLRGDVLSGVNREADAHLIAAAPDLYAALKYLVKQVDEVERSTVIRGSDIMADARTALAKARGES